MQSNMNNKAYFLEIEKYLEDLVAKTSYIDTFIPLSDRAVQNKLNSNNSGTFLVLIGYRGKLNENRQRTLGKRTLTFAILTAAKHDDALDQREKIDLAEWVGLNVISKIDLDAIKGTPAWIKNAFIKDSVHYEEIQYENFNGYFGQEFSLDLNVKNPLKFDVAFWNL